MPNIQDLVKQVTPDEPKYFVLQNRELIGQNSFTVLQNDYNSTEIKIITSNVIGGRTINADTVNNYNFYIDYLDGMKKPGVVSNPTVVNGIYQDQGDRKYVKIL